MNPDHFDASFVLQIGREQAWSRLLARPIDSTTGDERWWLAGFDSAVTVDESTEGEHLRATKDDEPCKGSEIVVQLRDVEGGTEVTVVQSRFGDWLPGGYDLMAVGWRNIVADLQTYLATGVHPGRHNRPWPDLGADVEPVDGGLRIGLVRDGTLASRLGLAEEDLLVVLGGAPVSTVDDLVTAMRVLDGTDIDVSAEWVRDGAVHTATAAA